MKLHTALFAVIGTLALPAFATSACVPGSGMSSGASHMMSHGQTRLQVQQETAAWKRNPVTADGWREVGGEAGWVYAGAPSVGKSRQQVREELAQWWRNPVTADGYKEVSNDAGWVYVGNAGVGKSRQQVNTELAQWQRNPVTADGYKEVSGEMGWQFVGTGGDHSHMASTPSATQTATATSPVPHSHC